MGELVDRDQEHLHLLRLSYFIMAGVAGFFTLFMLLYIGIGWVLASGVFPSSSSSHDDPRFVGEIFLCVGLVLFLSGLAITFLNYWAGRSLGECRRRTFCLVMAVLSCLNIPFGTAVGILTFIVLDRPSVRALFEPPRAV
jgi:hypothetical protein